MNPAALQGEHRRPRAGRHADRQHRRVRRAQPRPRPATPRTRSTTASLDALQGLRGADDHRSRSRRPSPRASSPRRRALEELLRAGLDLVDVHAPDRADDRVDPGAVRRRPRCVEAEHAAFKAGLQLRRDRRAVRATVRGQARRARRPAPTPTSPATSRSRGASSPRAQLAELPVFLGSTRSRPRPTSCTSCRKHKNFGVRTLQAEDEIAGVGAALGAAFGGHLGVTTTSGPGIDLKSETIGLAVSLELPLLHHRHPARRPVDRPAHQDRAIRPVASRCTAVTARRRCRSSRP